MSREKATAIGFTSILLWSLLALLTVASAPVPPFQLNAICFAIAAGIGLLWAARAGDLERLRRVSWKVYAFGTLGLFGYHALYFSALRLAPAAEAGLIAYLWPLFIVLFSGLLPGERLSAGHVIGAVLGLAGAGLVVGGSGMAPSASAAQGYGLACLCALTWSGYSVLSRRLGDVPTTSVAIFCLAASALSVAAHLGFETTLWPEGITAWAAVLGLGLGPVGLAFFVWDIGMKSGDIQLLGVASYAAPILSTLALVLAGYAKPTIGLAIAAALIAIGSLLAARASRVKRS